MKSRSRWFAVFTALAWCCVAGNAMADLRLELEPGSAQLVERVLVRLHPGSTLEWTPALTLVEGAVRRELRLGDIDVRADAGGGFTGVLAYEFVGERQAIFAAINAFEPAPSRSPAVIVGFKANAQREILETRHAPLGDLPAVIESVDDIELTMLTYHLPWPDAYVTYTGVYATNDFHGEIEWEAKVVFDPAVSVAGRAPNVVSRVDKKNVLERSDAVTVDVVDEDTMSFASGASGHVVSNCADPCLPDGRVLLALWWTSSTVVATP